jgi:acyl carrier protein
MTDLEMEIKRLIVDALSLEDVLPEEIETDAPLFGDGLGLDSIDALELGMALRRRFNITINTDDKDTRESFQSVGRLAQWIQAQGT